jgi:Cysteine rich repeat
MRRWVLLLVVCAAAAQSALAQDQLAAIRAACAEDAQKLCAEVQPGGGRIVACLKAHKESLSDRCKKAAGVAANPGSSSAPSAGSALPASETPASESPASAVPTPPSSPAAASNPATKSSYSTGAAPKAAAGTGSGSYLRMKQVQIIAPVVDPSLGNGKDPVNLPVLDLLIPSTWEFKSNVAFNTTSGCIADSFSVSWEAKSADGSTAFQGAPDAGWQYADDPAALHNLTDPNRRQINAQGKPCPVKKPMKAEDYFRQNVFTVFPNGSTVVSIDPFPELNEIARKQLGLAADDSKAGESQTEAIRARVEFQKDGKAMEDWVALVVVTRTFRQGRGAFYDCHAIDIMALRAEKGKLDASDKLFKVMISSLRPEAKWQAYSNHWIAWRYQVEAKKNAQIDAMIAAFQNHVAQTLNEVTANAQQGSMNSAFAFDQNIRGVQTFRDPTTGNTMELSNMYDHAWLNGSNEYIMSDDPNFNPNGQLNGSWNQLQVVQPQP